VLLCIMRGSNFKALLQTISKGWYCLKKTLRDTNTARTEISRVSGRKKSNCYDGGPQSKITCAWTKPIQTLKRMATTMLCKVSSVIVGGILHFEVSHLFQKPIFGYFNKLK